MVCAIMMQIMNNDLCLIFLLVAPMGVTCGLCCNNTIGTASYAPYATLKRRTLSFQLDFLCLFVIL